MTLEVMLDGVKCNIGCSYCYQQPMRDGGSLPSKKYDLEKVKATLEKQGGHGFTMFGGEALMAPLEDLEVLFKFGFEKFKVNDVQTNAVLVTDAHIEVFKKYNVRVGVSIDGPGELNDARRAGNLEQTREATAKSLANLDKLLEAKLTNAVIITLHRLNASRDRLPRLLEWVKSLCEKGLQYVRLHPMEVDTLGAGLIELDNDGLAEAMLAFRELSLETSLRVEEFHDIAALLSGKDQDVTCIWNGCDPWTTGAVQAVDGQGVMKNCGRTNKDGRDWVKAETPGYMRPIVLHNTPFEDGGCKGCRFFVACKGSCPGHARDGDWRNRPRECGLWMKLFEAVEKDLMRVGVQPVSKRKDLPELEGAMLAGWLSGQQMRVCDGLDMLQAKREGRPYQNSHGDSHGDGHGDHTDAGKILEAASGEAVK